MILPAISVKQPWASLIAAGVSPLANVGWTTAYRGPVVLLASNYPEPDMAFLRGWLFRRYKVQAPDVLPLGGVVALATLDAVVCRHASEWFKGPYAFVFKDVTAAPFMPLLGTSRLHRVTLPDNYLAKLGIKGNGYVNRESICSSHSNVG